MLRRRTRVKHRAVFAGFAVMLGFGSTLGAVGGLLGGGSLGSTPAGATPTPLSGCTVGVGIAIGKTVYQGNTTTKAPKQAVARVGDKIIYKVTVDTTSAECRFFTGTVHIKFPNGITQTLATGLILTPGTSTSFTANPYFVTNADIGVKIGTHTPAAGNIQAFATVSGTETHTTPPATNATTAATNFTLPVIHPETTLTKSVTPSSGIVPLHVTYTFKEKNVSTDPAGLLPTDAIHSVVVSDSGTGACTPAFTASSTPTTSTPGSTTPGKAKLKPGVTWTYTCTRTFTSVGTFHDQATATGLAGDTRQAGTPASLGAPATELSTTVTVTVSPATPTLTTKATATTATAPGKVKDTVTITGGDSPVGSVVVKVFKNTSACTGTPFATKTVSFPSDGTFSTGTITAPTAVTYSFEVTAATSTVTSNNKATTLKSACGAPTESATVKSAKLTLTPGY